MYNREFRKDIASRYDMGVRPQRPGESDLAYLKSLAKQADQRMVRLENLAKSGDKNFKDVLEWAYKGALHDIRALTNDPEATRFNRTIKRKTEKGEPYKQSLHARINAVKRFLESPSSMKSSIIKVYKKRADTINKRYDANLTWQEMANYYSSSTAEKIESEYKASKSIVRALGALKRLGEDPETIRKAIAGDIKVSKDAVVNEIAVNLLEQGLTFSQLTKS